MSTLAPTLQTFFTQRLLGERQASPHTVAAYRDTFRLLLAFTTARLGKAPSQLLLTDLDMTVIDAFLNHLEQDRGNSARTRNARLVAIHSLFRFAELRHPDHAHMIQRVLAIPAKRQQRTEVSFLTPTEVDALLAAPDRTTRIGRRPPTTCSFLSLDFRVLFHILQVNSPVLSIQLNPRLAVTIFSQ